MGIERTVNEELGCPILGLFDKPCSGDQLFTGRFVRSAPLGVNMQVENGCEGVHHRCTQLLRENFSVGHFGLSHAKFCPRH